MFGCRPMFLIQPAPYSDVPVALWILIHVYIELAS